MWILLLMDKSKRKGVKLYENDDGCLVGGHACTACTCERPQAL